MTSPRPRLAFLGTPDLARVVLSSLASDPRWDVCLVVAQPDKPMGRGLELLAPPVKQEALGRGLPVLQPARARDPGFLEAFRQAAPDVAVVAAYGQLLPQALLDVPVHGCLNVHTSLLPRWRGAAPIQWAILEGDAETGITLMRMDAGLDTGGIVATARLPLEGTETGQSLHDRLAVLGAGLLREVLPDWLAGNLTAVPQPAEGVTYAKKLSREDGRLDWTLPARVLERRVRAFNPWPAAFTTFEEAGGGTALLKIWEATPVDASGPPGTVLTAAGDALVVATGEGALRIHVLQREGRRRLPARDFLAGGVLRPGVRLGGPGASVA